ncbi:hypothetical protein AAIB33_08000 [Microbacterium sp. AZCO]|uniref:hypothetical protein n=1 Tax=Microbacterium sp. AZCO TaxID=3142976 RepID=UPI0031F43363
MPKAFPPTALTRLMLAVGLVVIAAGCGGCTAAGGSTSKTVAATHADAAVDSTDGEAAVTDAESCEAMGDVLTILHNAMVGLHEGRMSQQEYDGWMRLGTRVLDRVPTTGDGAVSDAIAAMKDAAPVIRQGAMGRTALGSPEWNSGPGLAQACDEAGYPLAAEGFIGG